MIVSKNKEIELKLLINNSDLKKLLSLECVTEVIRNNSCKKSRLISSYYDTDNWSFKNRRIAYRVRDKGNGEFEATIKTSSKNSAGLSERIELNLPLDDNKPVLDGFAELGLGFELSELAPNGVKKIFTVNVERTTYLLDLKNTVVELAIDKGKVFSGKKVDKIDEIELELVEGDIADLLNFIAKIAQNIPLFIEKRSKFARGLALCGIDLIEDENKIKRKMNTGTLHDELLLATESIAEDILSIQSILHKEKLDDISLKNLLYSINTLHSYKVLLEYIFGGKLEDEILDRCFYKINRIRILRSLISFWKKISSAHRNVLGNTSLHKKLLDLLISEEESLKRIAVSGTFTALVYEQLNNFYKQEWNRFGDLQTIEVIRNFVKQGKETMLDVDNVIQNMRNADDLWFLARTTQGKYFIKFISDIKKERKILKKQAEIYFWYEIVNAICIASFSKKLYREIGFLMGYLEAKQTK